MIKVTVLLPPLHDCQISFYYMLVILLYVLTELGYVLNVMSKRKENVVLKMLLQKTTKAQLEINGLLKGLFYATNLNVHHHGFASLH